MRECGTANAVTGGNRLHTESADSAIQACFDSVRYRFDLGRSWDVADPRAECCILRQTDSIAGVCWAHVTKGN